MQFDYKVTKFCVLHVSYAVSYARVLEILGSIWALTALTTLELAISPLLLFARHPPGLRALRL